MSKVEGLKAKDLYQAVDHSILDFETTEELEGYEGVLGQPRAVDAVHFGIGIQAEGYNIFALGPAGTGKHSLLTEFFEEKAAEQPAPSDWAYVHNFDQPHKPNAMEFPTGKGTEFREDMEQLVEELRGALESTFESEEYQNRRQEIQQEVQEGQEKQLEELRKKAEEEGLTLLRTPAGLGFAPVRDGEVIAPEEFSQLPDDEREEIEEKVNELQEELQRIMSQIPRMQREAQERMRELNQEMAHLAVGGLIEGLREKYKDMPEVIEYLNDVEDDVVENIRDFLPQPNAGGQDQQQSSQSAMSPHGRAGLRRYQVNVIVDHSDSEHGPAITEDNPTYQNLIGRVEHIPQMGALLTDFNLIKPGALHLANGGFLLLDARRVLLQPYAWDGLKRALRAGEIRIESPGQAYGLITTISLEPEPIPINLKVALTGDRRLYYLLAALDPEFDQLFKVMADFEGSMDRSEESQQDYAQLIATLIKKEELRHFDKEAVGRLIERGARIVGDSEKLTVRMRLITDLLREANYWANENGNGVVKRADVDKAIESKIYRADRLRERMQEAILRETILIDTEGEATGQINGLSVVQLGDFAFGRPSRITAKVRLGKGQVVDIEREVDLGGPLHSKGVMILSGFLGARYAEEVPLSLAATLVFEQSYGGVDGDSASSAELYALLSAIGEFPIRQSMAVTGSVNQQGQVQAIGGVNEKIEGFFDLCKERGLTGDQGVLIPQSNVKHLMLRQDVVEAVEAGDFHIYPVETVDEGIELLTGLEAGQRDEEGEYPEESVNGRVQRALNELAERRAKFAGIDESDDQD
ncbi:MAG: Lon protease family protein [Anaerolineales bacterium]